MQVKILPMGDVLVSNIAMPPSINKAYLGTRKLNRCLTTEARKWYMTHKKMARVLIPASFKPLSCKLKIKGYFYFNYPNRSDTSNYTKLTWDMLQKTGIIKNDNRFFDERCLKFQVPPGVPPYINLIISEHKEEEMIMNDPTLFAAELHEIATNITEMKKREKEPTLKDHAQIVQSVLMLHEKYPTLFAMAAEALDKQNKSQAITAKTNNP